MSIMDYKNLFLGRDQFLNDNTTNFRSKISNIVSIISKHSNIKNNWIDTNHLNHLSETELMQIQHSVANESQNELVSIIKPYVEPQIIKLFGNKQDINIRVSAQIKSRWGNDTLIEKRKVRFGSNGWYEDETKPNMAYPTRAHQDLDNNGNRSSHVIIFIFRLLKTTKIVLCFRLGVFEINYAL